MNVRSESGYVGLHPVWAIAMGIAIMAMLFVLAVGFLPRNLGTDRSCLEKR